jgi:hypothetical protein
MPVFTGKTGKLNGDLNRFLSQNTSLNHTLTLTLSHFVGEGETGIGRNIQNSYSPTGRPDIRQPITPTLQFSPHLARSRAVKNPLCSSSRIS